MNARVRAAIAAVIALGACLVHVAPTTAAAASVTPRIIVGDFNGDGRDDVLAYEPGAAADHLEYGTPFGFTAGPAVVINGTYTPVVGDFNDDGKDDILWYEPTSGHTTIWYGATNGFVHGPLHHGPATSAADVYQLVTGDFDHDGSTDVVFANVGPGTNGMTHGSAVWYGAAGADFPNRTSAFGTVPCNRRPDCTVMSADFDGDGFDDLLFYRGEDRPDKLLRSTGTGFTNGPHIVINGVYNPFVGDFDGDGKGDVFWYAPGPGADHVWYGTVNGFKEIAPISITGSYIPVVGDFDGDAHSDIVWYAPGSAPDYLRYGKATLFRNGPAINVNGTYVPAVGDFNGDGRDDIVWTAPEGSASPVWYGQASGFLNGPTVTL